MTQTYPTSGYRTAKAAEAGFQSFQQLLRDTPFTLRGERYDRDAQIFRESLRRAFEPSSPRTPIRTGPGQSIIPAIRYFAPKVARLHPWFRSASWAYDLANFALSQPWVIQQEGPEAFQVPDGWSSYACQFNLDGPWAFHYNQPCSSGLNVCKADAWDNWTPRWISPNWEVQTFGAHRLDIPHVGLECVRDGTLPGHRTVRWRTYRKATWSEGEPSPRWAPTYEQAVVPEPAPTPKPVPYKIAPYRLNSAFREAGYSTQTSSRRSPPPDGRGNDITYGRERPPGPDQSEGKWAVMSGGKLRNFVEWAFEGIEQVGIFHDALPEDCKAPAGATAAEQFLAVFACAPSLDLCKLIEGQINNKIEDKIVGAIGQAAKRSAQGASRGGVGKPYTYAGITKKLGKPYFDENGSLQFDPTLPFSIPKLSIC